METQDSVPTYINTLAKFLACNQIPNLLDPQLPTTTTTTTTAIDCIVLCGSAILYCAETVFSALESRPDLCNVLVICGGIGHSTPLLYEAIAAHPRYASLLPEVEGGPESRALHAIFRRFYDVEKIEKGQSNGLKGCTVLVEDRSTNCGDNAVQTRKILEANGYGGTAAPKTMVIVQDPTMARRTVAAFQKTYEDAGEAQPTFWSCPTFVPVMERGRDRDSLRFSTAHDPGVARSGIWSVSRFLGLIMGEIPRLRDDQHGYGPMGKGFIAHVDIPDEVEEAWTRLAEILKTEQIAR